VALGELNDAVGAGQLAAGTPGLVANAASTAARSSGAAKVSMKS